MKLIVPTGERNELHLSIDADGIIYRCGFAVEKTKYLVTDSAGNNPALFDNKKDASAAAKVEGEPEAIIWSRKELEPLENALHLVKTVLDNLPEHTTRTLWLTPAVGNFRERIATVAKYKGNRDNTARPTYYKEITEYLIKHHDARYTVGQEADDAIGIEATALGPTMCTVVSFDKDLYQIPGNHFNWVTKEFRTVSRKEGAKFFYEQALSGDPTDNIPGLEGVGTKNAQKILANAESPADAWGRVLAAYQAQYGDFLGRARAIETARLVYVRRQSEEIWNPPE